MVVFKIDDFLKGAGIEEIKTVDGNLHIVTTNKVIIAEIKADEERTGLELERKCKGIEFRILQKIFQLLHKYWEEIQKQINPNPEDTEPTEDDLAHYEPKHSFSSFEEWQLKVEESFYDLHKVVDENMPHAWPVFEFVLTVKAILHITEITLPFLGIVIAPSGAWKTAPIMALRSRINTFYTDGFSTHSLISHAISLPNKMREGDQHMLNKMKDKLVLMPELATTFSKKEEELKEIIGQLTRAADGQGLENDSGVGHKAITGKCQFNLIGATTEPPWYAWKYLSIMGPKIYFYRPKINKKERVYLINLLKGAAWKNKFPIVVEALNKYLDIFESYRGPEVEMENNRRLMKISLEKFKADDDEDALSIIVELALLLGPLRGSIRMRESIDDETGKQVYVHDISDIEEPERAVEQLRNLAKANALIRGGTSIGLENIPIVVDVTFSTTQRHRRKIFLELLKHEGTISTAQIVDSLNMHRRIANKIMEELALLELVTIETTGTQHEKRIVLREEFQFFTSPEFGATSKPANKRYHDYLARKAKTAPESDRNVTE